MPLSDLTPVLAASKRSRTGKADAVGKLAARQYAADTKRVAQRDALAQRDAQAEVERTRRFTALFSAIGKRDAAAAQAAQGDAAAQAAYESYSREVSEGFALPIIPTDILPGGRFARKSRELIVRNARQHTVGSLLLTSAGNDDLVTRAIELAYQRGDTVTVSAQDYGWRALDSRSQTERTVMAGVGSTDTRRMSAEGYVNVLATVPTLGGMYRAIRAAYALELSDARREVRTFSLDESFDLLADRPASRSVAPLTDDERAPRRRATVTEQRDAYAENMGDTARAESAERVNAFVRRTERMESARKSFAFGMDSDAQRDADVDKTCVALIAEGETLESISAYMGITRRTLVSRLSSARIVGRTVNGQSLTAFTRIAPDARSIRRQPRVKLGSDVIVTRATKGQSARRMSPITNENVISQPFTLTDEIRAQHDMRIASAESDGLDLTNVETAAVKRRERLDANAELLTFA